MPRAELIRRLADSNPLTPAAALVLLWTYFEDDRVGLSAVENLVRARCHHPLLLDEYPLRAGSSRQRLAAARNDLRVREDSDEFDLLALRWLKGLDRLLQEGEFQDFESSQFAGVCGRSYTLRRRNAFLASHYDGPGLSVRWAAHQGLSLAAYCKHFVVVPSHPLRGLWIHSKSSWGGRYLHDRLLAERASLRIMLWPFQTLLDYRGLEDLKQSNPPPAGAAVVLDELRSETELQDEVSVAIQAARQQKVTLLLFPELSIPPATEKKIRGDLGTHGVDGHPVLTLFGCSHRLNDSGDLHLNEAVLLGPDGSELHRHRKLVPFTDYSFGEHRPVGERLETGTVVTVLESALGNLTPLICIDLFNDAIAEVLYRCHGNLFTVPSLSQETRAHRTSAIKLQVRSLASTFVCNRWLGPPSQDSASFYRIPRQKGSVSHWPDATKSRYLIFDLRRSLESW